MYSGSVLFGPVCLILVFLCPSHVKGKNYATWVRTCEQFVWASLSVDTGHSAAREKEDYAWKKNRHRRPHCFSVVEIGSTFHNHPLLQQKVAITVLAAKELRMDPHF